METLPTHDQKISETLIRNPSEKGLNPKFSETSRRPTYTICLKLWYSLFLLFSLSFNVVFVVHLKGHGPEDQEICGPEKLNQVCLSCKYFEDSKNFLWMKQGPRWRRIKEEKDTCCFEFTESLHEMSKIVSIWWESGEKVMSLVKRYLPSGHMRQNEKIYVIQVTAWKK